MGEFAHMTAKQYREMVQNYNSSYAKDYKKLSKDTENDKKLIRKERISDKKSKFNSKKTENKGFVFDSAKESRRYDQLLTLEKAGKIANLYKQKPFILQPGFIDNEGHRQRSITYISDFFYYDTETKRWIVEDVKSSYTRRLPVYKIKKKMFLLRYPQYKFIEMV